MGATLLGFWAFALCAIPHAVATNSLVLKLALAGIAVLPLMIMAAPAKVSSSCDDLLDQCVANSGLRGRKGSLNLCCSFAAFVLNIFNKLGFLLTQLSVLWPMIG